MYSPSYSGWEEMVTVSLAGIIGAMVRDTITDGSLELPFIKDGKLSLGFVGGAFIGAFIGLMVDNNFITAALAGYSGTSVLTHLINNSTTLARTLNKPELDITTSNSKENNSIN